MIYNRQYTTYNNIVETYIVILTITNSTGNKDTAAPGCRPAGLEDVADAGPRRNTYDVI